VAYLRKDGNNWYVSWRDGGRGSKIRSLRVGPRKSDALKLKAEIEHRRLTSRFGIVLPVPIGFDTFADKWLASRTVKAQTHRRDRSIVRTYLKPQFGRSPVHAITPEQVAGLVARVSKATSLGTGKRVYAVLRKMLQDAKVWQYVDRNAAVDVRAPVPDRRREIAFCSVDELCTALEAFTPSRRPVIFGLMLTGLRWGEQPGSFRSAAVSPPALSKRRRRRPAPAGS
jgi:hypothetical protein